MSFRLKKPLDSQLSKISERSFDHEHDNRWRYLQHPGQEGTNNNDLILDHLISISSNESEDSHCKSMSGSDTVINIESPPTNRQKRYYSFCEPPSPNVNKDKSKKRSLPTLNVPEFLPRRDSRTSLTSLGSEKFDALPAHHKNIFFNLDGKDGSSDGKISKKSLQSILRTLQTPSDLSLDLRASNHSLEFSRQISLMDENNDGFLDPDEFAGLIEKLKDDIVDPEQKEKNEEMLENLEKGAYAEVCRTCPPPLFMITISFLQLGFYIYHSSLHHENSSWTGNAPLCSNLIYNPNRRVEAWRFLTYSLVHSGLSHILLNVSMQLLVGLYLEMSHGSWRVFLIYLIGVLSGSLASSCTEKEVHLAGASGGVYALIAANLSHLILNWKEDVLILRQNNTEVKPFNGGLIRLLKLTALVAFMVVDIIIGVYNNYFTGQTPTTSYGAHIAGAGIGLLAGILILTNRKVETWELWLQLGCYLLLGLFFLSTVLWHVLGDKVYLILYEEKFFPKLMKFGECP